MAFPTPDVGCVTLAMRDKKLMRTPSEAPCTLTKWPNGITALVPLLILSGSMDPNGVSPSFSDPLKTTSLNTISDSPAFGCFPPPCAFSKRDRTKLHEWLLHTFNIYIYM